MRQPVEQERLAHLSGGALSVDHKLRNSGGRKFIVSAAGWPVGTRLLVDCSLNIIKNHSPLNPYGFRFGFEMMQMNLIAQNLLPATNSNRS